MIDVTGTISNDSGPANPGTRRIVIVGGGIAGLAAAHRITELDARSEIVLLESSDRIGGILRTDVHDGYLIEQGADSFITSLPWAVDLCGRVGLQDQLLRTEERLRRTFVVCRGRLQPVPAGFLLMSPTQLWPILTTPVLSWRGKARLACELFIPRRRAAAEESLASFARRRLGREVFERLVQPLVGGIYSADPEKLSLAATMPRFIEAERQHRSLTLAARRNGVSSEIADRKSSGARYSLFVAPREGMESLAKAVAAHLPLGTLRLGQHVESVSRADDNRWNVHIQGHSDPLNANGLILCASTPVSAKLLARVDAELSTQLKKIPHAGIAIVSLAFRQEQISRPISGFGFVVPAIEGRRILAASISSNKFAGRAPDGHVLIRAFIGGACQDELLHKSDDELRQIAIRELVDLLGILGAPSLSQVARWDSVMPQYHLGHLELVESIRSRVAALPGLALAGNAFDGVGIPQVIRSGESAAESLLASQAQQFEPATGRI